MTMIGLGAAGVVRVGDGDGLILLARGLGLAVGVAAGLGVGLALGLDVATAVGIGVPAAEPEGPPTAGVESAQPPMIMDSARPAHPPASGPVRLAMVLVSGLTTPSA
jgi:hypothetical protein